MDRFIKYVGLDVHKETIAVALAEAGRGDDVREYGKIANTPTALNALPARCGGKRRAVSVNERLSISRGILIRNGLFEDCNLSVKVAKLFLERPRVGSAFFQLLLQSGAPDPKGIQIGFKVFHFSFLPPGGFRAQ